MSLSIQAALRDGLDRFVSRNGALLTGAYAVLFLVYQASFNGLIAAVLPAYLPVEEAAMDVGFTYPASVAVYAVAILALTVGISAFTVVVIRTFVAGRTDSIPEAYYTRPLLWATLNLTVGGLVVGLIVFVGSLFLLVPGIVAYVGLVFMTMFIAVEDENFVTALRASWRLVRPDFLPVFGLLLLTIAGVGIVSAILGLVVGVGTSVAGAQGLASIATSVVNVPVTLLLLAILSAASDQLRGTDTHRPA